VAHRALLLAFELGAHTLSPGTQRLAPNLHAGQLIQQLCRFPKCVRAATSASQRAGLTLVR
jgi:hypothetical protein